MDKLKSRKLWVTLSGVAVVAVATFLGVEVPDETMQSLLGMIAAYVVAEGVVDAAGAVAAGRQLGEAAKGVRDAADEVEGVAI